MPQDHRIVMRLVTRAIDKGQGSGASKLDQLIQQFGMALQLGSIAMLKLVPAFRVVAEPSAQLSAGGDAAKPPTDGGAPLATPRGHSRSMRTRVPSLLAGGS